MHELGDHLVVIGIALGTGAGLDVFGAGVRRGNDLDQAARRHSGKAVNIEDRFEDLVGLRNGYFGRGDDGHLALDPLIDDEVFAGQFADELDEHTDIHIVEINGDEPPGILCGGPATGRSLCIRIPILGPGAGSNEEKCQHDDQRAGHASSGNIDWISDVHMVPFPSHGCRIRSSQGIAHVDFLAVHHLADTGTGCGTEEGSASVMADCLPQDGTGDGPAGGPKGGRLFRFGPVAGTTAQDE